MAFLRLALILIALSNVPSIRSEATNAANVTDEYFDSRLDQIEEEQSLLISHLLEMAYTKSLNQRNQERLENQVNLLLDYIVQIKNATEEDSQLFDDRLNQLKSDTEDHVQVIGDELNTLENEMSQLSVKVKMQNHTMNQGMKLIVDKMLETDDGLKAKIQDNYAAIQDQDDLISEHDTDIKLKVQSNHDAIEVNGQKLNSLGGTINNLLKEVVRGLGRCQTGLEHLSNIFGTNGKCYYYETTGYNYDDAIQNCKSKLGPSAKLAEPGSRQEMSDIRRHVAGDFWIGINDRRSEGEFAYESSGNPVAYTNWKSGQPNGSASSNEDCGRVDSTDDYWWDTECGNTHKSLCEF